MIVIDDNSEDGRIRDSNVKLRRNSKKGGTTRKKTRLQRRRKMVTVGSHLNVPKGR
jgi:hypothetical protein